MWRVEGNRGSFSKTVKSKQLEVATMNNSCVFFTVKLYSKTFKAFSLKMHYTPFLLDLHRIHVVKLFKAEFTQPQNIHLIFDYQMV